MAKQAILARQRGCAVRSYDGVNAYNSVKRARMLSALANYASSVVGSVANLYAKAPVKLLF